MRYGVGPAVKKNPEGDVIVAARPDAFIGSRSKAWARPPQGDVNEYSFDLVGQEECVNVLRDRYSSQYCVM